MAVSYLLDSSALTRLRNPTVRKAILDLDGTRARPALVDLEIGYSAHNADEWDRLHVALEAFASVDVEAHHFRRAAQVQRSLAERGLKGRSVPDLLIAACAEDRRMTVVHYDADFDHIANVTGQPTRWVVERGSLD